MVGRTLLHDKVIEEGGSARPVVNNEELQFWVLTIAVNGRVTFHDPSMRLNAGQVQAVTVTLSSSMALSKDMIIGWRRNNETIGIGVVLDG